MKKALLWLWQAPQHLLALAILATLKRLGKVESVAEFSDRVIITVYLRMGLSLGRYIFVHQSYGENTIKHEQGHSVQSLFLGPLYLLLIGLPSLSGNIYDRKYKKGPSWYYKQPWEAWADRLGGVKRA
jgi:hypothetical protein